MFFDYFGYTTPSTDTMTDLTSPPHTSQTAAANGTTPSLTPGGGSGHVGQVNSVSTDHLQNTITPSAHNNTSSAATSSNSDISLGPSSNDDHRSSSVNNTSCATSSSNTGSIHSPHQPTVATHHVHSSAHIHSDSPHLVNSVMPTLSPQRINLNSGFGTSMTALYPSMHHHATMSMSDSYR